MKAMFAGFAAMALISIGAYFALDAAGFSSQEVYSSDSVRLD